MINRYRHQAQQLQFPDDLCYLGHLLVYVILPLRPSVWTSWFCLEFIHFKLLVVVVPWMGMPYGTVPSYDGSPFAANPRLPMQDHVVPYGNGSYPNPLPVRPQRCQTAAMSPSEYNTPTSYFTSSSTIRATFYHNHDCWTHVYSDPNIATMLLITKVLSIVPSLPTGWPWRQ